MEIKCEKVCTLINILPLNCDRWIILGHKVEHMDTVLIMQVCNSPIQYMKYNTSILHVVKKAIVKTVTGRNRRQSFTTL